MGAAWGLTEPADWPADAALCLGCDGLIDPADETYVALSADTGYHLRHAPAAELRAAS